MSAGGILAVVFLVGMVALILWNIRGHPRSGSGDAYGGFSPSGGEGDSGGD